jgi:hypothetical protein
MRRVMLLSLIGILSLGLVLTACGSDDDADGSSAENTPSASETSEPTDSAQPTDAPEATADDGSSTGSGDVSVDLTGALEANWGDDTVATCTSVSGQLNVSISNTVGSEIYALAVTQRAYTPGAYFLPESNGDANTTSRSC